MASILSPSIYRTAIQYLLLVSAMWVGPVPVVHSHANASRSAAGIAELSQHLQQHHRCGLCPPEQLDWHCHWIVRGTGYCGLSGEASVVQGVSAARAVEATTTDANHWKPLPTDGAIVPRGAAALIAGHLLCGANWVVGQPRDRISIPTCSSVMRC